MKIFLVLEFKESTDECRVHSVYKSLDVAVTAGLHLNRMNQIRHHKKSYHVIQKTLKNSITKLKA